MTHDPLNPNSYVYIGVVLFCAAAFIVLVVHASL